MSLISESFLKQFSWEPAVAGTQPVAARAAVGGMGGSHLAADLLLGAAPALPLSVHHDYGLPALAPDTMAIAVSHSGNTEETLDFLAAAHKAGLPCAAVSTGGRLLEFAAAQGIARVVLPQDGLQPRACVGYHAAAILALMGRAQELQALRAAAQAPVFAAADFAAALRGGATLIYSSARNAALAQYLKVQINETAKAPAFANTFPELNHNEMPATLGDPSSRVVLIRDQGDHPRVIARMDAFAALAAGRGIAVQAVEAPADPFGRLVSLTLMAQELSQALATLRGADPGDSSIIEDFKKRIA